MDNENRSRSDKIDHQYWTILMNVWKHLNKNKLPTTKYRHQRIQYRTHLITICNADRNSHTYSYSATHKYFSCLKLVVRREKGKFASSVYTCMCVWLCVLYVRDRRCFDSIFYNFLFSNWMMKHTRVCETQFNPNILIPVSLSEFLPYSHKQKQKKATHVERKTPTADRSFFVWVGRWWTFKTVRCVMFWCKENKKKTKTTFGLVGSVPICRPSGCV